MPICRALLVIAIVGLAIRDAVAQFGGMPGSGPPEGPLGPPQAPPAQCQQLLALREELQKHGAAISAANDKKADVRIACGLFRTYLATEAKMLKLLDSSGPSCGVPKEVNQRVRDTHAKAQQIGKQVCDAARGPQYWYDPPLDDDTIRPFKLGQEPRHGPGRARRMVGCLPVACRGPDRRAA
jgi:hypothetical protein